MCSSCCDLEGKEKDIWRRDLKDDDKMGCFSYPWKERRFITCGTLAGDVSAVFFLFLSFFFHFPFLLVRAVVLLHTLLLFFLLLVTPGFQWLQQEQPRNQLWVMVVSVWEDGGVTRALTSDVDIFLLSATDFVLIDLFGRTGLGPTCVPVLGLRFWICPFEFLVCLLRLAVCRLSRCMEPL